MIEATFVMIKPNVMKLEKSLRNRIKRDIVERYINMGLDVIGIKDTTLSLEQAEEHYQEHKGKDFYEDLTHFMISDEVCMMIVVGENAIEKVRKENGPTNVLKAREEAPTSIRALYGDPTFAAANAIHASDSKESAEREINRFFPEINFKQPGAKEAKEQIKQKILEQIAQ